jgi:hypothetical protein
MENTSIRPGRALAVAAVGMVALASSLALSAPTQAAQRLEGFPDRSGGHRICVEWDFSYRHCLKWIEALE